MSAWIDMSAMERSQIEERFSWRWWVTPKPLAKQPIHRWYVFPHSFTPDLVEGLIDEWGLGPEDHLLDPFAGAGTTLLAAKMRGIPALGYDLSPLAVLAARAKIANYDLQRMKTAWQSLQTHLEPGRWNGASRMYPELVRKALPGRLLGAFDAIGRLIDHSGLPATDSDFFRLALLAVLPHYSRAEATGGWLKWSGRRTRIRSLPRVLGARVEMMFEDLLGPSPEPPTRSGRKSSSWEVKLADARQLPDQAPTYTAVITSPPYPNRHDYTRVFGVELLFAFLDWNQNRQLRYQSFHSHPEAHPKRPDSNGYKVPGKLARSVARIRRKTTEPRLPRMLKGYFLDMYLCLREVHRVCQPGARIALVVGNAQYCGEAIPVDELTAQVGEQAGLSCEKLLVARYRGNSAQQMGRYGRKPSRESVVIFRKPAFKATRISNNTGRAS